MRLHLMGGAGGGGGGGGARRKISRSRKRGLRQSARQRAIPSEYVRHQETKRCHYNITQLQTLSVTDEFNNYEEEGSMISSVITSAKLQASQWLLAWCNNSQRAAIILERSGSLGLGLTVPVDISTLKSLSQTYRQSHRPEKAIASSVQGSAPNPPSRPA